MKYLDSHGNHIEKPADAPVLWRVAGYVVVWDDNKLLMVKSGSGLWILPGGGVEDNEAITSAAVRECAEETGYKVAVNDNQPIYVREQPFYHTSSEQFYHSLQLFYAASLLASEPDETLILERDKERESTWVDVRELSLESTHHTIRELIEKLKASNP